MGNTFRPLPHIFLRSVMASLRDILGYYRNYQKAAFLSIGASSVFEILDLMVPYAVGQF
jgi:ATP-binding cassette subfamily B protein